MRDEELSRSAGPDGRLARGDELRATDVNAFLGPAKRFRAYARDDLPICWRSKFIASSTKTSERCSRWRSRCRRSTSVCSNERGSIARCPSSRGCGSERRSSMKNRRASINVTIYSESFCGTKARSVESARSSASTNEPRGHSRRVATSSTRSRHTYWRPHPDDVVRLLEREGFDMLERARGRRRGTRDRIARTRPLAAKTRRCWRCRERSKRSPENSRERNLSCAAPWQKRAPIATYLR